MIINVYCASELCFINMKIETCEEYRVANLDKSLSKSAQCNYAAQVIKRK